MKRDMELIRRILQHVEDSPDHDDYVGLNIPERTQAELVYHVTILAEANFLKLQGVASDFEPLFWVRLTNDGHDFLDAVRSETVWGEVKDKIREYGGNVPLEVLKALAIQFAKNLFGIG
jgi:hypothetical protein